MWPPQKVVCSAYLRWHCPPCPADVGGPGVGTPAVLCGRTSLPCYCGSKLAVYGKRLGLRPDTAAVSANRTLIPAEFVTSRQIERDNFRYRQCDVARLRWRQKSRLTASGMRVKGITRDETPRRNPSMHSTQQITWPSILGMLAFSVLP